MLLFLSITGIFLSSILLYFNARKNPSTIYLALFFMTISTYCFIQYVMLYSKSEVLVSIFFLNIGFLTYLIGPTLYLYTRSILTDDSRLKKNDILHFLPAFVFFIFTIPHLFSPWSHKIDIAANIIKNGNLVVAYNSDIFRGLISNLAVFLSRPGLALGYLLWSLLLLSRFSKSGKESGILSHQLFIFKWLIVLFSFFLILIISHTIQIIESYAIRNLVVFYITDALQLLSGIGLIGLLISPFFFPVILYGIPRIPTTTATLKAEEKIKKTEIDEPDGSRVKGRKIESALESEYLLLIRHKLESCMPERQPYLMPDCNLAYVSKLIDVPAHHLAYYFREEKKRSFNDYRNEWRVKHAKNLIMERKASELTLEAIGMLSGFTNRNTFFISFKKVEGISPSAFLSQNTWTTIHNLK